MRGRTLFGSSVRPPAHVHAALAAIFGSDAAEAIGAVRIIEHSLFARLHGRAIATTRRRRIFLRGSAEEFFNDPTLMLHEYCHVLLQWEPGTLTTARYLREWLRHGYWNNRYEVEARAFAGTHEARLGRMLNEGVESAAGATGGERPASRTPRLNLAAEPGGDSRR